MIQMGSILKSADNSGAKVLNCIRVLGSKKSAKCGDIIKVSVRQNDPGGICSKKDVHRAVVVRLRQNIRRADGGYVKFDDNAVVLIDKQGEPIGTRIFGPVAHEVRQKGFLKIVSCATEVI